MFPVELLEDAAHHSFMSGTPSKTVQENDLQTASTPSDGHVFSKVAEYMTRFTTSVLKGGDYSVSDETQALLQPWLFAMYLEGSAVMKPPCNKQEYINPIDDPTCLKGSPWVQEYATHYFLPDETFANKNVYLADDDNFHPADEVRHYHHPRIDSTCEPGTTSKCGVKHISLTENVYDKLDETKL